MNRTLQSWRRTLSTSILTRKNQRKRRLRNRRTMFVRPLTECLEERALLASLTGFSFDDANANGQFDAAESP